MAALTWLHLSDWHQKGKEFDRDVVRDRLLEDIQDRDKRISLLVEQVDFIVFSGDVAHKGKEIEYQEARKQLFNPLLNILALEYIKDAQVRIAVMHHPFDWLMEIDRSRIEERLGKACHFILCGHQHVSQVKVIKGTPGDCITIPAGSCYDRRTPDNPRYTNAYNFVHLDFETGKGTAYLRGWNDRQNQWQKDQGAHEKGIINFELPKELGKKAPITSTTLTARTHRPILDKKNKIEDRQKLKKSHQVFISYSNEKSDNTNNTRSDRYTADMICSALETKNIRCWIDHRDILAGEERL